MTNPGVCQSWKMINVISLHMLQMLHYIPSPPPPPPPPQNITLMDTFSRVENWLKNYFYQNDVIKQNVQTTLSLLQPSRCDSDQVDNIFMAGEGFLMWVWRGKYLQGTHRLPSIIMRCFPGEGKYVGVCSVFSVQNIFILLYCWWCPSVTGDDLIKSFMLVSTHLIPASLSD